MQDTSSSTPRHHEIVILGGGTAGITVAARLLRADPKLDVAIIEPSVDHFYQPIWTLVGAGVLSKDSSRRKEADVIPPGAHWIRDTVVAIEPAIDTVVARGGERVRDDQLVVALGIQLDWHEIDGLSEALGRDGVCSNYRYDTVDATWRFLRGFSGGNALFTFPSTQLRQAHLGGVRLRREAGRDLPVDQRKERYSMYLLKAYGLPAIYWNGMLRGLA